ncbi:MAG: sigma-70 family RNA polymerase sigma factor [Saprospiraceae bacterium]|nr:sigma-70 family RNA polymerase sigma factor [Saprospiraceae bacterium]
MMIDTHFVSRLKKKDKLALSQLYDQYGAALYGQAYRILGSEQSAQEAIQDAFLKIWNNIDSYDESKGKFFTWMYRIARNEAIDKKRSKENRITEKTVQLDFNVYDTEADQSTVSNVEDIGVKDLLGLLDHDSRNIMDLVYFKGYTHTDVAKLNDIPLGTVKTKVRRAILKLRASLIKE